MDLNHKKTTLGDEAALYHHREDISEKEKWAAMSGREKWEYFKAYYLLKVVAGFGSAAFVIALLYTMFAPKPETVFCFQPPKPVRSQLMLIKPFRMAYRENMPHLTLMWHQNPLLPTVHF